MYTENQNINGNNYNIQGDQINYNTDRDLADFIKNYAPRKKMRITELPNPYINEKDSLKGCFYNDKNTKLVGRIEELKSIKKFIESQGPIKIGAITGRGGIGKTRLMRTFIENNYSEMKDWRFILSNWQDLKYQGIEEYIPNENIFIVFDYALAFVEEIGEWINRNYHILDLEKMSFKVRILILERADLKGDKIPYWYKKFISQKGIDNICDEKNFLHLENLSNDKLIKIANEFISNNETNVHDIINSKLRGYLENANDVEKTPLFLYYTIDAWISDTNNIKHWNVEALRKYIRIKEQTRIYNIFGQKSVCSTSLESLLVFSMAVSGLELNERLPKFLKKDVKTVRRGIEINSNIDEVLLEFKEANKKNWNISCDNFPEIIKELYCLEYLENLEKNLKNRAVEKFIKKAWELSPENFMVFLCRIAEDFGDHNFATIKGIFRCPSNVTIEISLLYAEVLREITFWNGAKFSDDIIIEFEKMISKIGKTDDLIESYVISLFNMWVSEVETKYLVIKEKLYGNISIKENFDINPNEIYEKKIYLFYISNRTEIVSELYLKIKETKSKLVYKCDCKY